MFLVNTNYRSDTFPDRGGRVRLLDQSESSIWDMDQSEAEPDESRPPLFSAQKTQFSRFQFKKKKSRADVIISLHHPPPTDRRQIITLHQLTIIRLRSISHMRWCPMSHFLFHMSHFKFLISKTPYRTIPPQLNLYSSLTPKYSHSYIITFNPFQGGTR